MVCATPDPLGRVPKGARKDEVVAPYRTRRQGRPGIVLLGVAQERALAWSGSKVQRGRHVQFTFRRKTVCVNHYYFYLIDPEWRPAFLKVCGYAPYAIKLCLNGHEWAKRQLHRRRVPFTALDNGFLACAEPATLQAVVSSGHETERDLSDYYHELLEGRYDCPDRIVLNGYFPLGAAGGGRYWWRKLTGSDETLDQEMAGRFSRRVHAYAKRRRIPLVHCEPGVHTHTLAEQYLPTDPRFTGLFLILVAKAPALVWEVTSRGGAPHLTRKTPWPYVNHYHFHIIDKEWGHLTFKLSGHPPFGVQVMLNGHEWVERRARQKAIPVVKEGNCFVGGSDFPALDRLADALCEERAIGRLIRVCER
jgi:hypothetical protein